MSQTRAPSPENAPAAAPATPAAAPTVLARHVCPFCGTVREQRAIPCPRCTMEDTTATRQATRARIGPWYVLQQRNPSAPGMRFDTLLTLVKRGQITPRSIVRGPTTHQLWRFAARVRGLSRQFGLCYSCGQEIETTATLCGHCHKMQEPPMNPDVLLETKTTAPAGLPVRREIVADSDKGRDSQVAADLVLPTLGGMPPVPVEEPAEALKEPADPAAGAVSARAEVPEAPSPAPIRPQTPHLRPEAAPKTVSSPVPPPAARRPSPADGEARDQAQRATDADGRPILSAKELAAAFKLDFILQPDEAPVAAPRRKRRHWVRRAVVVILLLGACGLGAAAYFNPSLRRQTGDWVRRAYGHLQEKWSAGGGSPAKPAKGPAAVEAPAVAHAGAMVSDKADTPAKVDSLEKPEKSDAAPVTASPLLGVRPQQTATPPLTLSHLPLPGGASVSVDASAGTPPAQTAHEPTATPASDVDKADHPIAPAAKPGPWDQLQSEAEGSPPAPAAAPVRVGSPAVEPAAVTDGDHSEEIRQLWISAIDAEGRGNYPQAVKLYEQIKRFPRDQWPVSLELRLEQVKKQIEENGK